MSAGMRERAQDERSFEFALQPPTHTLLATRQCLREFSVERVLPIRLGNCGFGFSGSGFAQLGGKIGNIHPLARRHHRDPMADVFELPHVARKRKGGEVLERFVRKEFRFHRKLTRTFLQKVPGERC